MQGIMMLEVLLGQTLKGIKKVTRRTGGLDEVNKDPDSWVLINFQDGVAKFAEVCIFPETLILKPRFKVGEIVYIKESFTELSPGKYRYQFDTHNPEGTYKWKNKMFMPEGAARFFIKITSIKIERLYDITEEQAILEGIEPDGTKWKNYTKLKKGKYKALSPIESVLSLFKLANKMAASTVLSNEWVWVYEYDFVKK